MKLVNIGFGNMINAQRLLTIVSPDSAPIKRLIGQARAKGELIDASHGRRTRAVLVCDSGHVVLCSITLETLSGRLSSTPELFVAEDADELAEVNSD